MSKSKMVAVVTSKPGLLMILSPAKSLDLSAVGKSCKLEWTSPDCDDSKTRKVASILKKKSEAQLSKTLGISANLAKTAKEYWSNFKDDASEGPDLKPCIFSFSGAAYQGLDVSSCTESDIDYMQSNLRIVDPLYGILRPLDRMQPYRLEMATKGLFPDDKTVKLADWWRPSVCQTLTKDLESRTDRILLNLASDEYSAAVDTPLLPEGTRYIKIVFWEEGRTIAVHAKRARGLMVRYLAQNHIDDMEGVKNFNLEGYGFLEAESDDFKLVFDRSKQTPVKKRNVASGAKFNKPKKKTRTK